RARSWIRIRWSFDSFWKKRCDLVHTNFPGKKNQIHPRLQQQRWIMTNLKGKVAVITGGNSGIGLASAKLFAEQGAQVLITGRRQAALADAVRAIGSAATAIRGDGADPAHHAEVADVVPERFGGADIYMATAGVNTI